MTTKYSHVVYFICIRQNNTHGVTTQTVNLRLKFGRSLRSYFLGPKTEFNVDVMLDALTSPRQVLGPVGASFRSINSCGGFCKYTIDSLTMLDFQKEKLSLFCNNKYTKQNDELHVHNFQRYFNAMQFLSKLENEHWELIFIANSIHGHIFFFWC